MVTAHGSLPESLWTHRSPDVERVPRRAAEREPEAVRPRDELEDSSACGPSPSLPHAHTTRSALPPPRPPPRGSAARRDRAPPELGGFGRREREDVDELEPREPPIPREPDAPARRRIVLRLVRRRRVEADEDDGPSPPEGGRRTAQRVAPPPARREDGAGHRGVEHSSTRPPNSAEVGDRVVRVAEPGQDLVGVRAHSGRGRADLDRRLRRSGWASARTTTSPRSGWGRLTR